MFRNTRMISGKSLSSLLFRDRPDRLGSLILAGYVIDHALMSFVDDTGMGSPKPLSGIDVGAMVSECRAMADDPVKEFRIGEYLDEVRGCDPWDAEKAVRCALATLSRGIDGRWRDSKQLDELLKESNVLVDMRGIAMLRWRSDIISREYNAYLEEWRPRVPDRHSVGLRDIDVIGAGSNVVETFLVYTVPRVFERASPNELQASFRPRPAALVSCASGVGGRTL